MGEGGADAGEGRMLDNVFRCAGAESVVEGD